VLPASRTASDCGQPRGFSQDSPLPSGAFPFGKTGLHRANNNAQVRGMMRPQLATGGALEVHETTLPPSGAPTETTHHHPHSEMWPVREGTIELTVVGEKYPLDPGSMEFVRSHPEHGIPSVGTAPAFYFVVALGPGAEFQE
jgi:mannose-6-phosphate isomerase-like protein (cupin superfamily)